MATGAIDPSEWYVLVQRIQEGDPTVSSALADRERRLDNYFGYFEYEPVVTQSAGFAALAVTSSKAQVVRIGFKVQVFFQITVNAAGTAGQGVTLSVPPGLTVQGDGFASQLSGTWHLNDSSTGINYVGTPYHFIATVGRIYGITNTGTNVFGVNPAITLAAGDILHGDFEYLTSATGLF